MQCAPLISQCGKGDNRGNTFFPPWHDYFNLPIRDKSTWLRRRTGIAVRGSQSSALSHGYWPTFNETNATNSSMQDRAFTSGTCIIILWWLLHLELCWQGSIQSSSTFEGLLLMLHRLIKHPAQRSFEWHNSVLCFPAAVWSSTKCQCWAQATFTSN